MARQIACIRLYDEPRPMPPDRVMAEQAHALLVYGIVNPFGPTLTSVMGVGELKPGETLPVVELMLNPFSQEVQAVGELAAGQEWQPPDVIRSLFSLSSGNCPSLLLPTAYLEADDAASVHADFLRGFSDARCVLSRVKRYLGNPWDRISEEMEGATNALAALAEGGTREAGGQPLNDDEAKELAGLLLSEEHTKAELQAFFAAWSGSIEQLGAGLPAMSLENFVGVFGHLASTCRLPDLTGGDD